MSAEAPEGRQPPFDLEAEATVLASVMIDPSALAKIDAFLRPDHFHSEAHRRMFEGALALKAADTPLDATTLLTWLKDRERLAQVGGTNYVLEVLNCAPVVANIVAHALIVFDKHRVRQTIAVCQRVAAQGHLDYGDAQEFIDGATRALATIARHTALSPVERNIELLKRRVRELAGSIAKPDDDRRTVGIATGIAKYDRLTLGLHAGQKTTIGALPGRGKSSIALQIAVNVASQGYGVLYFSQEMTKEELVDRQLSMLASVDSKRIQAGRMSSDEWQRIYGIKALKKALPIVIDDTPEMDMHQVKTTTLAQLEMMPIVEGVPLGLVIVDYLQRLKPMPEHARRERHEQIYESARAFKNLCRSIKVPGVELAQQTKPDPKSPNARPLGTSFAGCRDIANEADQVVFLHREENGVRLLLLKQRGGPEGDVLLRLRGEFSRFEEVDEHGERAAQRMIPASREWIDGRRASAGDDQ